MRFRSEFQIPSAESTRPRRGIARIGMKTGRNTFKIHGLLEAAGGDARSVLKEVTPGSTLQRSAGSGTGKKPGFQTVPVATIPAKPAAPEQWALVDDVRSGRPFTLESAVQSRVRGVLTTDFTDLNGLHGRDSGLGQATSFHLVSETIGLFNSLIIREIRVIL
jgi:hypothetical protein